MMRRSERGARSGWRAVWGRRRTWQVAALAGVAAAAGLVAGVWIPEPPEPAGWELNRDFETFSATFGCGFRADESMQCRTGRTYRERGDLGRFLALDGIQPRCGIRIGGRLRCWGQHYEIGPRGHPKRYPFDDERFTALSAGHFECALRTDRVLRCTVEGWDPKVHRWVPEWVTHPPAGEFTAVSVGSSDACAIRVGGALVCWGDPDPPSHRPGPLPAPPAGEFISVSVGRAHACAVRLGGALVCWGDDADGRASPPAGRFTAVAVDRFFSCGLGVDGEVRCWGLRIDDPATRPEGRTGGRGWNQSRGLWPAGPFTALDISRWWDGICAVRAGSGEAVCWNDGTATHQSPGGTFTALDAGAWVTCGLRRGGAADCWGHETDLGYRRVLPLNWDIPAGPFAAVAVGEGHACGLRAGGEAVCWGSQVGGRAGVPPVGPFTALSASENVTCGLRPDGEATCWGSSDVYGDDPVAVPPAGPFTAIRVGRKSVCGLRPGGDMVCRGTINGYPLSVPDGAFTELIAPGIYVAACGLRASGEIACSAAHDGRTPDLPGGAFSTVSTAGSHFCGLRPDGEAECWNAATTIWHEPTPPGPFTHITTGAVHACGLRPDGTAECWTTHWPPSALPAYPPNT